METKIKWNEGEGYITATYEGSGSGSASISSDVNEGIDREQFISVNTTQGSEPKSELIQVTQIGLREVFLPNDGDFLLADGGTFNVLKRWILPSGFKEVEYIESNGSQWIDTGFKPNQDTRVLMEVKVKPSGSNWFLFGARSHNKENNTAKTYGFNVYNTFYRTHYYNGWDDYPTSVAFDDKFTLDKNKNITTLDKKDVITSTDATFQCDYNMYLFACNTANSAGTFGTFRMYSCKIYDNGTLIRDYIPCVDMENALGLYDTVNRLFYKLNNK